MSGESPTAARERRQTLPEWLRPRAVQAPGHGRMQLIETTLLLLLALLLVVATLNDVARQAGTNHRLIADLHTWRTYSGHAYRNLSVDQEVFGPSTQRDVVCGNTSPGAPKARIQLCLAIWGPTRGGLRTVHGGWYLPPKSEDQRADRYGCFGAGVQAVCTR